MTGTNQQSAPAPLSAEDRAILNLERGPIVGHTCKVIVLGEGAPDAAGLRERIVSRLDAAPALRRRLGGSPEEPVWIEAHGLDLDEHVVGGTAGEPVDAAGLRAEVARLFAERLDRTRPLWRMDLLPLAGGDAALVWRIHHALADGTTCVRLATALLWDDEPTAAQAHHRAAAADDARRRAHLAGFVHREFARSRRSPFDGKVGTRRVVDFAAVPLAPLHDAAKRLAGATLNDAVLAIVGGGVERWLEARHGKLRELRVKVPVSLHTENADEGNRDSFFEVGVPLAERDPVKRLQAVHTATVARKDAHDAEEMDAMLAALRRLSPRLESFCDRIERSPRSFALNVSNVPGPPSPVTVAGAPVRSMHSLAEIAQHHALRVAAISYAGNINFGFCADPEIVTDLDGLAAGVEAEAEAVTAAA
jgi:diacylglycerol O-acyltransferase / wax synthase